MAKQDNRPLALINIPPVDYACRRRRTRRLVSRGIHYPRRDERHSYIISIIIRRGPRQWRHGATRPLERSHCPRNRSDDRRFDEYE